MREDAEKEAANKLPIPELSRALIKWLRLTYPIRQIGADETLASANRRAGFQDLIDKLDFLSQLQAKAELGELDEETMEFLVFEAPTKQQEEDGYVLRIS